MNFKEALEILDIEEYRDRIFNSNSHGELFHLWDYMQLAKMGKTEWFKPWFEATVEAAGEHWDRPESVFQHIPRLLQEATQ